MAPITIAELSNFWKDADGGGGGGARVEVGGVGEELESLVIQSVFCWYFDSFTSVHFSLMLLILPPALLNSSVQLRVVG